VIEDINAQKSKGLLWKLGTRPLGERMVGG